MLFAAAIGLPERELDAAPPALGTALANEAVAPEVRAFYAAHADRPIWTGDDGLRSEGRALLAALRSADLDGLDPARYDVARLDALAARTTADPAAGAELEVALAQALLRFARDLRSPSPGAAPFYVDAELAPRVDARALLERAAGNPMDALAELRRAHPVYAGLREELRAVRAGKAPPAGLSASEYAALIVADMDRARALPVAGRHVLVDAGSARLWMYEDGRAVDSMRVIVGKPDMATPALAGLIRFALFDPYWNLPPDLARVRAERMLAEGPGVLARERIELLSDFGPAPRRLDPAEVDWEAVAQGRVKLRMRQLPGADNMMGAVKFMLPNRLGIYLHDTPSRALFDRADRRLSSGCVRVEDWRRLARWLFRAEPPVTGRAAEHRADLPQPVPVHIIHLTALPEGGRVTLRAPAGAISPAS